MHGKPLPASFGKVITPMGTGGNNAPRQQAEVREARQVAASTSRDWLPHMATCADDFAVLRACWADGLNHVGSVCQMNTGSVLAGRPSLGSWALYGLGTREPEPAGLRRLRGRRRGRRRRPQLGHRLHARDLPGHAVPQRPEPDPEPEHAGRGRRASGRRRSSTSSANLNDIHRRERPGDSQLDARHRAYELAFRMQATAPEAVDLSKETGEDEGGVRPGPQGDGRVRPPLPAWPGGWSSAACGSCRSTAAPAASGTRTRTSKATTRSMCRRADQPIAALLKDLKRARPARRHARRSGAASSAARR